MAISAKQHKLLVVPSQEFVKKYSVIFSVFPDPACALVADKYEQIVKGCVSGHNIFLYPNKSVNECAAICDHIIGCQGFEYGVAYGGSGSYKPHDCQLQSSSNTAGCNGGYHNLDFYKKGH